MIFIQGFTIFNVPEIRKWGIISAIVSVLLWYYLSSADAFELIYDSYWNYVSLSVTLLGFLITAFTILFTFPVNYKIELLTLNKNYPLLFDAFLLSIYTSFIVLILSLMGVIINIDISIMHYLYIIYLFMLVWMLVNVGITVWILKNMIEIFLSGKNIE